MPTRASRLWQMMTLTPGDGQDLLAAFKRGWERRDPDAIVDLFDEHAEYRVDPFTESLAGSNAIRALWNDIAATQANVEFDAERVWVVGSAVLASWHAAYTRRADGQRLRVRGFSTFELSDAPARRVVRYRQWPIERAVGIDSTFKVEGS
jgi:limonene-1,2-epoxide hydrolase